MPNKPEAGIGVGESKSDDISGLPAELGFETTPEILAARNAVVAAMTARDWDAIKQTVGIYHDVSGVAIDALDLDIEARAAVQIGLIIDKALMWREAGKLDSYAAELDNAARYASNINQENLVARLDAAIAEVDDILQASIDSPYQGPPTEEIIAKTRAEYPQLAAELDLLYALPPEEVLDEVTSLIDSHPDLDEKGQDFHARMGWIA